MDFYQLFEKAIITGTALGLTTGTQSVINQIIVDLYTKLKALLVNKSVNPIKTKQIIENFDIHDKKSKKELLDDYLLNDYKNNNEIYKLVFEIGQFCANEQSLDIEQNFKRDSSVKNDGNSVNIQGKNNTVTQTVIKKK